MKTLISFAIGVAVGYFVKSDKFKSLITKAKTWWENR